MTPPNPLTELAERVQALTEACRETDLAIMQAISGHPWRWADSRTFEPQTVITWDQYGADAPGNPVCSLEDFTGSFDNALMLALEGWDYCLSVGAGEPAHVAMSPAGKVAEVSATAATPALAFTAAVFRARAASEAHHAR